MTPILIRSGSAQSREYPSAVAGRLLPAALGAGRGAAIELSGGFETRPRKDCDGCRIDREAHEPSEAEVTFETPKSIIARDISPGIPFDRSIDPYGGCDYGCLYCLSRQSHVHLGYSARQDLKGRQFAPGNAAELLERELGSGGYWPAPIAFGANADPYQPVEGRRRITRALLEVLQRARHPVSIVTKSNLILRDLDVLSAMGRDRLVKVSVSVTTLDEEVARKMEPLAPAPRKRLEAIEALNDAGVPAGVMLAPIIPAINDAEIETVLTRAHAAGAREASHVVLDPPGELRELFRERLLSHYPDRLRRAVSLMQAMYDDENRGARRRSSTPGSGPHAFMIKRRFDTAARRLGYRETPTALRTDLFRKPVPAADDATAPILAGGGFAEARGFLA